MFIGNATGRLGSDPELRSTKSGQPVCNLSVAVDRFDRQADPIWLRVTVWGKQGENCARYLSKGSWVSVTGRVDTEEFTRNNGDAGYAITLNASDVAFVGSRQDGGQGSGGQQQQRQDFAPASSGGGFQDDDDIPF